jgi:hypothetical protein
MKLWLGTLLHDIMVLILLGALIKPQPSATRLETQTQKQEVVRKAMAI